MNENDIVVVSAVRTAVGRGKKGSLADTRPDELAALVIQAALERISLDAAKVDDVLLGCAMPEGAQGLNVARMSLLLAGLPQEVGGVTINRFCASGLQAVASAAQAIAAGDIDVAIAGGVESMSSVPMGGFKNAVNPRMLDVRPEAYIGMGHTAERLAAKHSISRSEQDEFALNSHQKAAAAQAAGKFKDEIVPVKVRRDKRDGAKIVSSEFSFDTDELVRSDASMEGMAKLKPAFNLKGSVTPGNSSPLSDGAAALVLMKRSKAQQLGLQVLARFRGFAVAGVAPEIMGIGPVAAIPKLLARHDIKLADVPVVELNEAFAAQCLAVGRELPELDWANVNVNGGAIALGHPLGATGAKLSVQAIHELRRRGGGLGLVSMCIGGGQGAAGLFEV